MADTFQVNIPSTSGARFASAELTFSGDTAQIEIVGVSILTGSEGSWTQSLVVGGAGVVTGGVQRVTLASDDPAVALLGTIDADTSKIPALGNAAMAASTPVTLASDDTLATAIKTATEATQAAVEGTLTVGTHDVTNAGTFLVQTQGEAPDTSIKTMLVTSSGILKVCLEEVNGAVQGPGTEATAIRVTIATDSTGLLSVDDNDASLTVDTTGTAGLEVVQDTAADLNVTEASAADIKTSVQLLDNIVSAVGVASTNADPAAVIVVRREDTLSADFAITDGDYSWLKSTSLGALWVAINGGISGAITLPTGASTANNQATIITALGTGATGLGKAEDTVHSSGDVGVMSLGVRIDIPLCDAPPVDDYTPITISEHGCQNVDPQHWLTLDDTNAIDGWTVINNDTDNLATSTIHVWKTASLSFDKVDGAGNTTFAGIQKTISSISFDAYMEEGGGYILGSVYLSDVADVDYVWIRIGTNSGNYNEWQTPAENLAIGWNALRGLLRGPTGSTGNGWNSAAVTYIAVGVSMLTESDALAAILVDGLHANSGLQTAADIVSQTTTSVSSPNVKINGWLGSVSTGTGSVSANGTLRVVVATDDTNLAAQTVSLGIMDDWDDGSDHCEVVGAAAEDAAAAGAPVQIGGRYDASPRGLDDGDVGAIALTPEAAAFAAAAYQTDFAYDGNVKCTIKRSSTVEAASGTNELLAAVGGKKFRILSFGVFATSATSVAWYLEDEDSAAVFGTAAGKLVVDVTGADGPPGFILQENAGCWLETPTANKALEINLAGAVAVLVVLTYIEVD